uniref:Uncharacterized protein n=1 Tax=Cannabis sativa TaxID=3483 RepID=A0A803PCD5_CANSA
MEKVDANGLLVITVPMHIWKSLDLAGCLTRSADPAAASTVSFPPVSSKSARFLVRPGYGMVLFDWVCKELKTHGGKEKEIEVPRCLLNQLKDHKRVKKAYQPLHQSFMLAKLPVVVSRDKKARSCGRSRNGEVQNLTPIACCLVAWARAKASTLQHVAQVSKGNSEALLDTQSRSFAIKGAASLPILWTKLFSKASTLIIGPVGGRYEDLLRFQPSSWQKAR